MIRRPPRSTRTATRFPYTTLFRSHLCPAGLPGHRHKQRARILAYEPSAAVEDVVEVGGVGDHAPVEVFQGGADVVEVRHGAGVADITERVGGRSGERRVGHEVVSAGRSWG